MGIEGESCRLAYEHGLGVSSRHERRLSMTKRPKWCLVVGCPVAVAAGLTAMALVVAVCANAAEQSPVNMVIGFAIMLAAGLYTGKAVGWLFFRRWDWFSTCGADYESD